MKLQNRLLLLGLSTLLVGGFVYTHIFLHRRNRKDLEDIAREISLTWKDKIGLSEEQSLQLEDIIIEFTIRKNEIINGELSTNKIQRLQKVQANEHKRLRRLMSPAQFDAYVGINKKIPNRIMDS